LTTDHADSYTGPKLVDDAGVKHHRDGEELRTLFQGVAAVAASTAPPETQP
jgi:hypothetical protein